MISSTLGRIMQLQKHYSSTQSEQMKERQSLVTRALVTEIEAMLDDGTQGVWKVFGSNGIGNPARVPWVRIYNPVQSPSPQEGWYLVLLFSADGEELALSLNQGVTKLGLEQIVANRKSAVDLLQQANLSIDLNDEFAAQNIHLADPKLGALYEKGHVTGYSWGKDTLPTDATFKSNLSSLLERLQVLPNSSTANAATASDEVESFLKITNWSMDAAGKLFNSMFDSTPQIVLAGPPGTGKTFVAKELAKYIISQGFTVAPDEIEKRISIVQFHPSYGYEDFVEGLRPVQNETGNLVFSKVAGIILSIAEAIEQDGLSRVLIIDEMNRANLPRVFGELMYLLEYRESEINLMYHGRFKLPANLYIVGTMNTADRSIKNIDFALRRRFDFFEVKPDVAILRKHYKNRQNLLGDELFAGFTKLNQKIELELLDRNYAIGHSYFMKPQMDRDVLRSIWDHQISPLLEDYFFDRSEPLAGFSLGDFWNVK